MTISRDVISAHFAELGMLKRPGPDVAAGHSEVCRIQKNVADNSHDSTISETRGDLPSLDKAARDTHSMLSLKIWALRIQQT